MNSDLEIKIIREKVLEEFVNENSEDVLAYLTASQLSKDPLKKGIYAQKMLSCVRRKGTILAYLNGCIALQIQEKYSLLGQLKQELTDAHPVMGRLCLLGFNIGSAFV